MKPYRDEFVRAISLLAEAFGDVLKQGYASPVLVGGAVAELYTGSAIVSGDFDVLCAVPDVLRASLSRFGFRESLHNPHGAMIHDDSGIAVEIVSGSLFDGKSDRNRLIMYRMSNGHFIPVPPIEDMIADRIGQYNSAPQKVPEMREQALILYRLAPELDEDYLDKRIREESCGDYTAEDLKEWADERS